MNPVYKKALEKIWSSINVGVQHPNDFERVVYVFDRLLSAAERVGSDQIRRYYEQLGAPQEDARDISMIYDALEISHKREKCGLSDEWMQEILEAS